MKIGISRKILIFSEAIVVTVIILCGLASLYVLQKVVVGQAEENLKTISNLKKASLGIYLDEELEEFEFFANNKLSKATLGSFIDNQSKDNKAKVFDLLNSLNYENDPLVVSHLLDNDGNILVSSDPREEGKILVDKKYFISGKLKSTLSTDYDILLGAPVLVFVTPLKNENGDSEGVLIKRTSLHEINKTMSSRTGLGQTGETFLVNVSNLVITDLLKEKSAVYKKTIYLPQINLCLSGASNFSKRTDYFGDQVYGYWQFVPELDSCLSTKIDSVEVMAPIRAVLVLFLAIFVLIGLSGGVIGLIFSKSLVGPIIKLRDETSRIKGGNFNEEVVVETNDEIGELATAFNEMGRKVKEEQSILQREVEEKTKQLNAKLSETTEMFSSSEKMNELMIGRELAIVELKKKINALEAELAKKVGI